MSPIFTFGIDSLYVTTKSIIEIATDPSSPVQKQVPAFELFVPLTYALPSAAGNRMLLSLREIFYTEHDLAPGQEEVKMKVIETDARVTIQAQEGYNEFDSFFGAKNNAKETRIAPQVMMSSSSSTGYH